METQTRLSRHNKFISVENIIILSVSSDDYLHASLSVGRVLANGLEDLGSIPGRVIPKTLKMVLNTSLINTQQYKVRTKGKVEQSKGKE